MAKLFLTYKLKAGISRETFEAWTRERDYPAMRGLTRVHSFVNHRTVSRLFSEASPSCDYIEVFDIPHFEGFIANDLPGDVVQAVMGDFMGFVENPEFIVAEDVV